MSSGICVQNNLCGLSLPRLFEAGVRATGKGLGMPETFIPASLRGSGATFLYETTENTDPVARRGRWMSQKTTNICVQEVQVASVLPQLDVSEKLRILSLYEKGYSTHTLCHRTSPDWH